MNITKAHIDELSEMFQMLSDSTRLGIMLQCMDEPVGVSAMADALGVSHSLVSHHLRLLRATRLVRHQRHGRAVRYQVNDEHVRTMLSNMVEHLHEDHTETGDE